MQAGHASGLRLAPFENLSFGAVLTSAPNYQSVTMSNMVTKKTNMRRSWLSFETVLTGTGSVCTLALAVAATRMSKESSFVARGRTKVTKMLEYGLWFNKSSPAVDGLV